VIALALQAAATFNLICTGTSTAGRMADNHPLFWGPFTVTIRVDLASRRWCEQECRESRALAAVSTTTISFEEDSPRRRLRTVHYVNRESGEYRLYSQLGGAFITRTGTCERAPYSGLPAR
jgi:hypothetical protein